MAHGGVGIHVFALVDFHLVDTKPVAAILTYCWLHLFIHIVHHTHKYWIPSRFPCRHHAIEMAHRALFPFSHIFRFSFELKINFHSKWMANIRFVITCGAICLNPIYQKLYNFAIIFGMWNIQLTVWLRVERCDEIRFAGLRVDCGWNGEMKSERRTNYGTIFGINWAHLAIQFHIDSLLSASQTRIPNEIPCEWEFYHLINGHRIVSKNAHKKRRVNRMIDVVIALHVLRWLMSWWF